MTRDEIFTSESFKNCCMGDLIGMGSLEDYTKALEYIAPPVFKG